ncbi:hypothetical protein KZ483_24070 [Paenibacillus sp. sptzw28]|uniref:hypothetical protein n=1 Tax=Paenibacillus sp. sptzw28 TaxID=715179 RepID=UPI001C6EF693|nr:hypothetical protein [Paenibacillus sp. sptzw28]QYR20800.1 hypothetical protein KZ483_24070 [Paenibacillus sp. sptzw28]
MSKAGNDVVIIELDRPRVLRFGHKALKKLTAFTGTSVEEVGTQNDFDLEELETIFFYGLERDARESGETLTLEMMEDILDYAPSLDYLLEKMQEALRISFSGTSQGNGLTPAATQPAQNRAQRRGIGKTR